jgi:hypothetical protein
MSIPPEVLIYVQSVREYFKKSDEARNYFIGDSDEELFFEHLTEISQKNFEKNSEVMLDQIQFELLRKTITAITIATTDISETKFEIKNEDFDYDNGVFIELPFPDFGTICLN